MAALGGAGHRQGGVAPATPKREGEKEGGCRPPQLTHRGPRWAPWSPTAAGTPPPAHRTGVAPATPKREGKEREFGFWGKRFVVVEKLGNMGGGGDVWCCGGGIWVEKKVVVEVI